MGMLPYIKIIAPNLSNLQSIEEPAERQLPRGNPGATILEVTYKLMDRAPSIKVLLKLDGVEYTIRG